ncbi:hypothetical protein LQ327_14110 [Actinomycetospora endophytica]|uniref:Uncharacterized protein n=1 Tax=Actinomycetospora endophytica TaxID=2291215 RepID=A0ABS8P8C8_9PSEU|nr:hypothetical protein [Actinomycetospora endophytica]MCD2194504.1 hypothetical protein [Actinomycetospora endophytica]
MSSPSEGGAVADDAPAESDDDLADRLERSPRGRALISVVIVVLLGTVLVVNMPDSITKRALQHVTAPIANVVGLDQGWAVYAPSPRQESTYLEARVLERDGTTSVHPTPIQHGLAEYWDYRWQRYADTLLNGPDNRERWAPYARWIADQDRAAGHDPAVVTLVNISSVSRPPGGPARSPWAEHAFFSIGVGQ